jgi:hypothetical protein
MVLPVAVYVLVREQFVAVAVCLVILSKWRMFAVRPRFWPAHIRANSIDLMVGISIIVFMDHNQGSMALQLLWTAAYAVWLLVVKPKSSNLWVMTQAFIGQLFGLLALYLAWGDGPVAGLTLLTGLFCFLAARHFFDSFDEPYARMLSYVWGYFGASLAWVLSHWLLFYSYVSQPTLLLTAIGYGLAALYYLDHRDRLTPVLRNQFIFIMIALVVVVIALSQWGNKVV